MPLAPRIVGLAAVLALLPGVSARQASPRNASYTLAAVLDPAARTIQGRGRLTWRNASIVPATELQFHLYWNAWRDRSSSWMREDALTANPIAERPPGESGSIDLTALALVTPAGAVDLLAKAHYIAADDGNEHDRTVLSVPLDRAVRPGETLDIDLAWTSRVPRTFARTGVIGNYFFIAHWFPKIGVLEETGWNTRQFHRATEFFADYGVYDVELRVPAGWVVGATGVEQSRVDNPDGTTTHRFVQSDVHDFAWTTSPDFLDVRRRIEAPGAPAVELRLLLQPEHADQADRHADAARETLARYGQWFAPYPYGHLTIVDPVAVVNERAQGRSTGGMEYPTLVTAGTRWLTPWREDEPEDVVMHEVGHQFWYGVVGSNEVDHAWMDEGINTYATARLKAAAYPGRFFVVERYLGGLIPWTYLDVPWSRDLHGNRRAVYRAGAGWNAPSTPTWRQWPAAAGSVSYARTALWLTSLERMFGWETVQRALARFHALGAYRHPGPDELFSTFSSIAGRDLTWFFDAVHRSSATFDYAVARVTSTDGGSGSFESTVVVRRLRDGIFPVSVQVAFDDGWSVTEQWDGRDLFRTLRYRRKAPVSSVEIDPARVLTLDVDVTNNSWTARPAAADVSRSLALRWVTWFETVLLTYAFFV
jgi:hypothetical protein